MKKTHNSTKHPRTPDARKGERGFSLLEILIAMAILVTVAGAFTIVAMRASARGNSTTALQSIQAIGADEAAFQNSWGGFSPSAAVLGGLENANTTAATALLDEEINTTDATALDAGLTRSGYKLLFFPGGAAITGTGGAAVRTGFEIGATPVTVSGFSGAAYCVDPSGSWEDVTGVAVPSTGVCKADGFVTQLGS